MLSTVDLIVLIVSVIAVMAIGIIASRKEDTAEDFFLAGRSVRWWGVAGSIFGSNVSANHLIGMLGIGYSIGFAQSHFELGAIAALLLLGYGFLPVYRKLGVTTLSEYLGLRYDNRSRTLYSVILLLVAVVQLTAGFYIGSRSLGLLLRDSPIEVGYVTGIVVLVLITATYTIVGGLKAVIYTDVIQSVLLLGAGILVAVLTLATPEVGGWDGMMAWDAARPAAEQKMHLYLPSSHPDLPWSGALSGLLVLHCFYWSTNQTIVQRTLAARSDQEARIGIVVAGFLKLTIPFFAIAGGVAAARLFELRLPERVIDPDAAAPELIALVVPMGYGLVGLIMAGLLGAILSSIDSLVNSATTLVVYDLYQPYLRPKADEREFIFVGRVVLAVLLVLSALLAVVTYDPSGAGNFFLRVSSQAGHFTPGLVAAFALGMFWRRATAIGAALSIAIAPVFSFTLERLYPTTLAEVGWIGEAFGSQLNFLHRVMATVLVACLVHLIASRLSTAGGGARYTFAQLRGVPAGAVRTVGVRVALLFAVLLTLGGLVWRGTVEQHLAAMLGALIVWPFALRYLSNDTFWRRADRWASTLLVSVTVLVMFWWF